VKAEQERRSWRQREEAAAGAEGGGDRGSVVVDRS
jgi:hypothetical protein